LASRKRGLTLERRPLCSADRSATPPGAPGAQRRPKYSCGLINLAVRIRGKLCAGPRRAARRIEKGVRNLTTAVGSPEGGGARCRAGQTRDASCDLRSCDTSHASLLFSGPALKTVLAVIIAFSMTHSLTSSVHASLAISLSCIDTFALYNVIARCTPETSVSTAA